MARFYILLALSALLIGVMFTGGAAAVKCYDGSNDVQKECSVGCRLVEMKIRGIKEPTKEEWQITQECDMSKSNHCDNLDLKEPDECRECDSDLCNKSDKSRASLSGVTSSISVLLIPIIGRLLLN